MGEESTSKVKAREYYFHKVKRQIIRLDSFDGCCPFDQLKGGECSQFSWENCSICTIFKDHVDANKCPECGAPVIDKWSGVKCSNPDCEYWFCF